MFSNVAAFEEHVVRPRGEHLSITDLRDWRGNAQPCRCARVPDMEKMATLRKVGGVWFKSGKDV